MEIKVLEGQSFLDIAIQETGNVLRLFSLARENNLSISDPLTAGQTLTFTGKVGDKQIREYYRAHKINPATEIAERAGSQRIFSHQFSKEFS